jgi:hypothetical protein
MGDEEPVSQQPPADEEQDQTTGQTTEEPPTDQEEADKPETTETPGEFTPESHYPGG